MANTQNNQKLSEIRRIVAYTPWPTSRNFIDPCWLEHKSLLMTSKTIEGFRKKRELSTRFTYGDLFTLIKTLLRTAITGTYTLSGKFNFATNATNAYCNNSPSGRNVISYKNLSEWLNGRSGFEGTIKSITYGDHIDPKFCRNHNGSCPSIDN